MGPIGIEIRNQIEALIEVKQAILRDSLILARIERLAKLCLSSLLAGGENYLRWKRGSFADAQHLSAEFTSRFQFDRDAVAVPRARYEQFGHERYKQ